LKSGIPDELVKAELLSKEGEMKKLGVLFMPSSVLLSVVFGIATIVTVRPTDAGGQAARANVPVRLRYLYAPGTQTAYQITFRQSFEDERKDATGSNKSARAASNQFGYQLKVESFDSESHAARLSISFNRVVIDFGGQGGRFDSANPDQLSQAKSAGSPWLGLLGSTASARLTDTGDVVAPAHFSQLPASYDAQTQKIFGYLLEDIGNNAVFRLPQEPISPSGNWNATVPIRFFGGLRSTEMLNVDVRCAFDRLDSINGEQAAVIKLSLAKQPVFGVPEGSEKGFQFDTTIEQFEGTLVFSITRGDVIQLGIHATIRDSESYQGDKFVTQGVLDNHHMQYEVAVDRM
jgi:hypothetical protein